MSSHALARKLLELPDAPVGVDDDYEEGPQWDKFHGTRFSEIESVKFEQEDGKSKITLS